MSSEEFNVVSRRDFVVKRPYLYGDLYFVDRIQGFFATFVAS